MNGKTILAVALAATLVAGAVAAQGKGGPKLYRWVDKDGKVHYDQALPPEAVNQARKEFSTSSGMAKGEVERALTEEERAAKALAEQKAAQAAASVEELKRQEEIMMQTYNTENDLRRAYGDRITLLQTSLESTGVSIKSLRENLASMLTQASNTELANQQVDAERATAIRGLHDEFLRQQQFQANRRVELEQLNAEFARMLARYRELKDAAAAAATAAPTADMAPTAPPAGG